MLEIQKSGQYLELSSLVVGANFSKKFETIRHQAQFDLFLSVIKEPVGRNIV